VSPRRSEEATSLLGSPFPWKVRAGLFRPASSDSPLPPRARDEEASHVKLSKRHAALIAPGIAGAMALPAWGGGSGSNVSGSSPASGGRVIYGEATDWPQNLFQGISAGN